MDNYTRDDIDLAAVINEYTYLDDFIINQDPVTKVVPKRGMYLKELMKGISLPDKDKNKGAYGAYVTITEALKKHPEWGELQLVDRNGDDHTPETIVDEPIQAVCFKYPNKNGNTDYYVAYRGTGEGRWADNGVSYANESSMMQEKAAEYFDYLAERTEMKNTHKNGGRIVVTGHSKGGNEAQFVTMASKNGYLIDDCYSFDGQKTSKSAIEAYKKKYGEEYFERQAAKVYSICGDDDPVNRLGYQQLASPEKTYFVGCGTLKGWHSLDNMLLDEDGKYSGIRWSAENDGHGKQGAVSKVSDKLNERIQALDEKDQDSCAMIIMTIINIMSRKSLGDKNDEELELMDYVKFATKGVPIIFETLFESPEGWAFMLELVKVGGEYALKKWGPIGLGAYTYVLAKLIVPLAISIYLTGKAWKRVLQIVDIIITIAEKIEKFAENVVKTVKEMCKDIKNFVENIGKWVHNHINAGARYSYGNTYIYVDTDEMRSYAMRINSLNARLIALDGELSRLYSSLGTVDKALLMSGDKRIGNSKTLTRSRDYLNGTADLFDEAERKMKAALE